jgi:uncharacterized protein (TIGR00266 family)
MQAKIIGESLPVLEITIDPGDKIVAEPGEFSWMTSSVAMNTTTKAAGAKNIFGALGRAMAGGGLFMTEYTAQGAPGMVAFSAKIPGAIVPIEVTPEHTYMIHSHGFLAGTEGVELGVGFQKKLGAGLFGGEGFVLQKLGGTCTAWVELGGEVVTYDLAPGEVLQAHPGHIGMFDASVTFDVKLMKGLKNMFFGGDGLFVAHLTGPGRVWTQSLTISNLAHALTPYLPKVAESAQEGIAAGIAGSLIKGLFSK